MREMQAPQSLALGRQQAILAPTHIAVGLADPIANRLRGTFEFPFQLAGRVVPRMSRTVFSALCFWTACFCLIVYHQGSRWTGYLSSSISPFCPTCANGKHRRFQMQIPG
jgi:hypothetical protein